MTDRDPPPVHQNEGMNSEPTIASTLLGLLREHALDDARHFTQRMAPAIAVQAADGSQFVITEGIESELDVPLAEFSQRPWRIYHGVRVIRYSAGVDPLEVGPHDPEHDDSDYVFDSSEIEMVDTNDVLDDLSSAVNTIARLAGGD